MRSKYLLVSAFLVVAGAAWAADTIHPLDVRPGMWEYTITMQTSGLPPIPAEVLNKLTPEQKAQMEARMGAMGKQPGKPMIQKHCLTKEDLEKPMSMGESKGQCKRTIALSTSTKQEVHIECESPGGKMNGTVRVEAADPEHIKMTAHMTSGEAGKGMTVDTTGTGKWLSAACTPEPAK